MDTGESVVLREGSLVSAVRASTAIPGIFHPLRLNDRLLVDGGLVRNLPVDVALEMGADIIMCDPHRVVVNGPSKLRGRKLTSPDLRAGITLLIASLIAKGQTEIDNIHQIDRGYEDIDGRLRALGAEIKRIGTLL